jgi:hypothetical protein
MENAEYATSANLFSLLRGGSFAWERPVNRARRFVAGGLLIGWAAVGAAQVHESFSSTHVDLSQVTERDADGKPAREDFRLSDGAIWVRKGGEWHVEAQVSHPFLLCGTYRVGVHFGVGNPGCTNVEWLTDLVYVTSEVHCNQATRLHVGGDTTEALKQRFAEISCAERTITCTGRCR